MALNPSQLTSTIPLPGVAIGDLVTNPRPFTDDVIRLTVENVAETSQINTSVYTADGNPVALTIDGASYAFAIAGATIAQVVAGANAIAAFNAIAVASNPSGTTLQIAFRDKLPHVLSGASVNFAAFAEAQAASTDQVVYPGRFLDWAEVPERGRYNYARLPVAGGEFAGVSLRQDLPSDAEATGLGATPGALLPGNDFAAAARWVEVKVDNRDAVTDTAAQLVYRILTAGADHGKAATSDGSTPGEIELTVTAGGAADVLGGSLDSGPTVLVPGGSSTVDNTDASALLSAFQNSGYYASRYSFSVATNVVTAVQLTGFGTDPTFTDASAGTTSIADAVSVTSIAADAELISGAAYTNLATAGDGVSVRLPR